MTAAGTKTSAERLGPLEELYVWEDDGSVRQLLAQHPETHAPLIDAARLISRYFGPDTRLSLGIERDLDGNEPPRLAATIHTAQSPTEALTNLDRFDEEWWLDSMRNVHHHVSFGLRFA
jgi:hypothetical protein